MTQPGEGAAPQPPVNPPEAAAQDPLAERLADFAAIAGRGLTPSEVALARRFYEFGRQDAQRDVGGVAVRGATGEATSATQSAEDSPAQANTQVPADQQPVATKPSGPVEDRPFKEETLRSAFLRQPHKITFQPKKQPAETFFSEGYLDAMDAGKEPKLAAKPSIIERESKAGGKRREVVAFTQAPDEYREVVHGDDDSKTGPVVLEYRADNNTQYGEANLDLRIVLPGEVTEQVSEALAQDPRSIRRLVRDALEQELASYAEGTAEHKMVEDAIIYLEELHKSFDAQPGGAALAVLTNVPGIGGGIAGAQKDGYARRELVMTAPQQRPTSQQPAEPRKPSPRPGGFISTVRKIVD